MLASFPKVPNTERSKAQKSTFSITPLLFDAALQGTPANIRRNVILPKIRITGLYLHRWQYGSIFIHIFVVGFERHTCFEIMALQGHPRSLILAPIKSAYATSYWSLIVTLVLPCLISETLWVFCWEEWPHLYSTRILGVSVEPDCRCCGSKEWRL